MHNFFSEDTSAVLVIGGYGLIDRLSDVEIVSLEEEGKDGDGLCTKPSPLPKKINRMVGYFDRQRNVV